ncbi:MAG: dipeptide epimerase, partial [Paracoccaceae bacterium]
MKVDYKTVYLKKRYPLAISRGLIAGSDNLFVSISDGTHTGWGEMAPGASEGAETTAVGEAMLRGFCKEGLSGSIHQIWADAIDAKVAPCALAALDMALWDLRAKQADMPLYRLLGLSRSAVISSLTIGINPPETVRQRVPILLGQGAKALKIKLGSPEGIDADKAMFAAVLETAKGSGAAL